MWGGSKLFEETIISKLRHTFDISKEDSTAFKYIGIDLQQYSDKTVNINQASYVNSIKPILIDSGRQLDKNDLITNG